MCKYVICHEAAVIIFIFLIKLNHSYDYSKNVTYTYYDKEIFPKANITPTYYKFTVKVIAGNRIMGTGVSIHQYWVLSSKFFGDKRPYGEIIRVATWDSSKDGGKLGEVREVEKIVEHPNIYNNQCNFDLVLLKLEDPFFVGTSSGIISFRQYPTVQKYDNAIVTAAYRETIDATEVALKPLEDCDDHEEYESYDACPTRDTEICIEIRAPVYGAPVIFDRKLIGIVPSDIDVKAGSAVFHFISSYIKWMKKEVQDTLHVRSKNVVSKLQIFNTLVLALVILVCEITILVD